MQAIFNPHSFKQIKCYLKEVPIVVKQIIEPIVEPIIETIVEPIVESIVEETKSSLYNDN
jgi:hypothetical protein